MKYVHTDGTEYEVGDLIAAARFAAEHLSDSEYGLELSAASALLARHERVCEALKAMREKVAPCECPTCLEADAALRGEEAKDV